MAARTIESLTATLADLVAGAEDPHAEVERIREALHRVSPSAGQPVDYVRWVPIEMVEPNDYNPNSVARIEMSLLLRSIDHDGYTQPIVTIIEPRVEIRLPCSHMMTVWDQPLSSIFPPLSRQSLAIPLASSTEKEASGKRTPDRAAASASRSAKRSRTTDRLSASGSVTNGESGASTDSEASATSPSGTSPASEKYSTSLELVCPTCASSDPKRKQPWTSSTATLKVGTEAYGLQVNWITSSDSLKPNPQPKQRRNSTEAPTPSEPSAENSDSPHLRVADKSVAVIVDGFHRYFVMKQNAEIRERCNGRLPIVVIEKDINDRMAATIRHNRARGKHSVTGMANMVFTMLDNGMSDEDICNELGMEAEELLRIKHITGFSKLFADREYNRAWITKNQIQARRQYREQGKEGARESKRPKTKRRSPSQGGVPS